MRPSTRLSDALAVAALAATGSTITAATAENKYDPGVTDKEIKIGNIMPYSGPASAYGVIGQFEAAYIKYINEKGGLNGRKIDFIPAISRQSSSCS